MSFVLRSRALGLGGGGAAAAWSLLALVALSSGCAEEPPLVVEAQEPAGAVAAPPPFATPPHAPFGPQRTPPVGVTVPMEALTLNTPEETGRYDLGLGKPRPSPEEVAAAVARAHGVLAADVEGTRRLLAEQARYLEAAGPAAGVGAADEAARAKLKQQLMPLDAGPRIAGTAARVRDLDATPIFQIPFTVPAGVGYTVSTSGLAPATADTVLHVLDVTNAAAPFFIAGNDDSGGTLASSVSIPATAAARTLRVLVRGYSTTRNGTATLSVQSTSGGGGFSQPVVFGGNVYATNRTLLTSGHVMTVEQPGGSADTVLLVVSGAAANAVAFDDDSGVDRMAWLHLFSDCPSCVLVVGSYFSTYDGKATLIWDEDAHAAACDADGMGDALELAVGADPCRDDSDGDGLPDGLEVVGAVENGAAAAVKLPRYGADPTRQDVFVELDWTPCSGDCGPASELDYFRMTADRALATAAFYAPEVALHLDTGVPNADPATQTIFNDWGGARRIPAADCNQLAPGRAGIFHHVSLVMKDGGGQGDQPGSCVRFSSSAPEIVAHELGHNLGLDHGGSIAAGRANYKPHYRSMMNYAYVGLGFSRGRFANAALNPTSLDESFGLGTSDLAAIDFLTQWPWFYSVSSSGAVDWNRDGIYAPPGTRVRAAIGLAGEAADQLSFGRNVLTASNHPVGAWTRTTAGAATFALVTRRISDGALELRTAAGSSFASCENLSSSCVSWSPARTAAPRVIATMGGSAAPAVARFTPAGGGDRLMVVATNASGQLFYTIGTLTSSTASSWTSPLGLPGAPLSDRDPALVVQDGVVSLLARTTNGVVKRWDYNPATAAWSGGAIQLWANGAQIVVGPGVAVTRGYQRDLAAPQTYALFPTLNGLLQFARFDTATARWILMQVFPAAHYTLDRPSLIYVPHSAATPAIGRFYLSATRDHGDPYMRRQTVLVPTSGNDASPTASGGRLEFWWQAAYLGNEWLQANGGAQLVYDVGFDDHVRALLTYAPFDPSIGAQRAKETLFLPLADGIFNLTQRDENDFTRMAAFMSCSLHGGCVDF